MAGNLEYVDCEFCGGVLVISTDNADGIDYESCKTCGYHRETVTPVSDQYEATGVAWSLEAWYDRMSNWLEEEGEDPRNL